MGPDSVKSDSRPEGRADVIAYAVAVLTLIPLGALLRTPILNFLCGPAYVIAVVTLVAPAIRRRLERGTR